ncbi:MAG: iron-containing alcohol dehydrogenase [Anaeroplasma sp.]
MENFIYNTPTKIFFGKGEELKIGQILASYGFKKILLHYGQNSIKKSGLYDVIIDKLKENKIDFLELGGVEPNPKLSLVHKGVELCKKEKIELILAVGGGSVIDSAKAIAVGAKVDFSPWKFSIKEEEPTEHLPVATILTLAAAGSDMSSSCVITNDETKEKRGFNSEYNRPLFSILNPELTYTVGKYQTACGIVDIMMHTLERFFSKGESFELTDNIAIGLLKAVINSGKMAIENPNDYTSRSVLMWANSLSHNGLTSCGRSFVMSVHQIEHEISGMFDYVSHGAGLAVLWPNWAIIAYKNDIERFKRFAYEVMEISPTENIYNDIEASIKALKYFFKEIGMPTTLRELNVPKEALNDLAINTTFKGKRIIHDIIDVDYKMALKILEKSY